MVVSGGGAMDQDGNRLQNFLGPRHWGGHWMHGRVLLQCMYTCLEGIYTGVCTCIMCCSYMYTVCSKFVF